MKNLSFLLLSFMISLVGFISCQSEYDAITEQITSKDVNEISQNANLSLISNGFDLVNAVNNGAEGSVIELPSGTFVIDQQLRPKAGMIIKGAGRNLTIITNANTWNPGIAGLPDQGTLYSSVNTSAYMIDLGYRQKNILISSLTLKGQNLHGAMYGYLCDDLEVYDVNIQNFLWCGIRTFEMSNAKIHNNVFEDAGGEYNGTTGGGIYVTWVKGSKFYNNKFKRTANSTRNFYGIKGHEGRNCEIYQNTIRTGFSIEFAHENDYDMDIHHNYLTGTVSIPKYAGGTVPASGSTFHIHHNYFSYSYSLEWSRSGAEVDNNLFDFDVNRDEGNLISCWTPYTDGSTKFHDNLIKNPGRGVFWSEHVYNGFQFYNNHVITNTTTTPRNEGLFGFNSGTNFSTIKIENNIIECFGLSRPLMRNSQSYNAIVSNNKLVNVSDASSFVNMQTATKQGPINPLKFELGSKNEYAIDGWNVSKIR